MSLKHDWICLIIQSIAKSKYLTLQPNFAKGKPLQLTFLLIPSIYTAYINTEDRSYFLSSLGKRTASAVFIATWEKLSYWSSILIYWLEHFWKIYILFFKIKRSIWPCGKYTHVLTDTETVHEKRKTSILLFCISLSFSGRLPLNVFRPGSSGQRSSNCKSQIIGSVVNEFNRFFYTEKE